MTAFLQNDVLVFAFLFAHDVPYQHSAIMINVVFPKPLTPNLSLTLCLPSQLRIYVSILFPSLEKPLLWLNF